MKKLINNNKIIFIFIVFILCVLIIVIGTCLFFKPNSKNSYGDRLNGINEVKITNDRENEIRRTLDKSNLIDKNNITINGKIIYISYQVKDDVTREQAKEIANKVLECFSEEEINFYDIQFIIENKKPDGIFVVFGSKNSISKNIVWTNN